MKNFCKHVNILNQTSKNTLNTLGFYFSFGKLFTNSNFSKNFTKDNYNYNSRRNNIFHDETVHHEHKPLTQWGSRYNRKNAILLNLFQRGSREIYQHIKNVKDISQEQSNLIHSEEIFQNLKVYHKNILINDNDKSEGKFEDFNIEKILIDRLKELKFEKLAPIQRKVVKFLNEGKDLIGVAQTGSGKTLAFLLPIINNMIKNGPPHKDEEEIEIKNSSKSKYQNNLPFAKGDNNSNQIKTIRSKISFPLCVILAPTRELAMQIYYETVKLTHLTGIIPICCYGGVSKMEQVSQLKSGVDIIIATPGRLKDLLENDNCISLKLTKTVILDEADRMLDIGFGPSITSILNDFDLKNVENRQNVMFSATFENEIKEIAKEFLKKDDFYFIGDPNSTFTISKKIEQNLIYVEKNNKLNSLLEIVEYYKDKKILIFSNKKSDCDYVCEFLKNNKIESRSLHGDIAQYQRQNSLKDFKNGIARAIVATDVASRGIDISDIGVVINLDTPNEIDDYVHRIGRTGRKGTNGIAITYITDDSSTFVLKKIMQEMKKCDQKVPDWVNNFLNDFSKSKNTKNFFQNKRQNNFNRNRN